MAGNYTPLGLKVPVTYRLVFLWFFSGMRKEEVGSLGVPDKLTDVP